MAKAGYFLKIDGIDGECTDDKHPKWIELVSFSWGASANLQGSHSGHGGLTGGNASFQDLHATKFADKATPKLMLSCATGKPHPTAELHWVKAAGSSAHVAMAWKLTNVLVSSVQVGGSSGTDFPQDSFSLNYSTVELEYKEMDNKGTAKGSVKMKYDLTTNKGQ